MKAPSIPTPEGMTKYPSNKKKVVLGTILTGICLGLILFALLAFTGPEVNVRRAEEFSHGPVHSLSLSQSHNNKRIIGDEEEPEKDTIPILSEKQLFVTHHSKDGIQANATELVEYDLVPNDIVENILETDPTVSSDIDVRIPPNGPNQKLYALIAGAGAVDASLHITPFQKETLIMVSNLKGFVFVVGSIFSLYIVSIVLDYEDRTPSNPSSDGYIRRSVCFIRDSSLGVINFVLPSFWTGLYVYERDMFIFIFVQVVIYVLTYIPTVTLFYVNYGMNHLKYLQPDGKIIPHFNPLRYPLAAFIHFKLAYMVPNMVAFCLSYYMLSSYLGHRVAVFFYISAALFSNFAALFFNTAIKGNVDFGCVGATGAIYGIIGYAATNDKLQIKLFGIIYLNAKMGALALLIADIVGLFVPYWNLDHMIHISGILFGYLYYTCLHGIVWGNRKKVLETIRYI